MMSKVLKIQDFKALEDLVSERLGIEFPIIAGMDKDGNYVTYFSRDIPDIELSYSIQCLQDRRNGLIEVIDE